MSTTRISRTSAKSLRALGSRKSFKTSSRRSFYNNEEIYTFVVIPPDGGWGWMVVFCSFICNFFIDGNLYAFGLYISDISKSFNIKVAQTVFVGSVLNAMTYIVGPFVSACLNRYDFRLISIIGCIVATIAYLLSFFAWNYSIFLISYGVLLGIGYGIVYVPAMLVISLYFAKWRALAVSLASTGSGLGTLVMPQIINFLLNKFQWQYTFFVFIGFLVITAAAVLSFRPIEPVKVISRNDNKNDDRIVPGSSKIKFYEDKRKYCSCCHWRNKYFPTTDEVIPPKEAVLENIYEESDEESIQESNTLQTSSEQVLQVTFTTSFLSTDYCIDYCIDCCNDWEEKCNAYLCCESCQTPDRPMYRDDIFYRHSLLLIPQSHVKLCRKELRKIKKEKRKAKATQKKQLVKENEKQLDASKKREILEERAKELERKQAKDNWEIDIDEAGTSSAEATDEEEKIQQKLKENEIKTLQKYHMSVTRVTTAGELQSYNPCCFCDLSGLRILTTMLDFHLLKSVTFLVLSFNGYFFTFGYMIPFLFIYDRAIESGIDVNNANWFLSFIGLSNTIGRLLSGFLPCVINVNTTLFICFTCFFTGIVTVFSGVCMETEAQIVYACFYGLLSAPFLALRPVLIVEIFGLEDLTNIFGLQLLFSGIATMNGVTIAGYLRDLTNNYTNSFYLAGGCIVLSSFMVLVMEPINKWEKRRME